jgi:hypothetical protein
MTSNNLGDFIKCTVVSRMLPEVSMFKFASAAAEIWTMFSNQSQTGRCLAFLHLVGLVCEAASVDYEKILGVLEDTSHMEYEASLTLPFDTVYAEKTHPVVLETKAGREPAEKHTGL